MVRSIIWFWNHITKNLSSWSIQNHSKRWQLLQACVIWLRPTVHAIDTLSGPLRTSLKTGKGHWTTFTSLRIPKSGALVQQINPRIAYKNITSSTKNGYKKFFLASSCKQPDSLTNHCPVDHKVKGGWLRIILIVINILTIDIIVIIIIIGLVPVAIVIVVVWIFIWVVSGSGIFINITI